LHVTAYTSNFYTVLGKLKFDASNLKITYKCEEKFNKREGRPMGLGVICDIIILVAAVLVGITNIYKFFANSGKGIKKKA
jgi:hypothetical protein